VRGEGVIMSQLMTGFARLDEFFRTQIHKPAENKGGLNYLESWNEYHKLKRYIKLCILHIIGNKTEFDWKWLHESKVLTELDYKIFPELKEYANRGEIKTSAQAFKELEVAFRDEAAKLMMLAQERAKQKPA
jgi:hypothetical protein